MLRNSEVGQLKEKISIVYDENAELKKMVRYSKLQVQVLRKEIDALRKAYRTEMEEMYNQSIANEDELRNDLLSAANEEMNMVVKDLTTRFEEEKQWLVSNLTETHHIDIAKLKENLRSYEIGTKDLESRIQELKDELQSVTLGNTVHRDQELMSHQHVRSSLVHLISRL